MFRVGVQGFRGFTDWVEKATYRCDWGLQDSSNLNPKP